MAPLNILIGGESFREIREQGCYYVDKTAFLEEMLAATPPKVSLITRPRRFGKTLAMTMLQEFFDIRKDSRSLFEGLAVSKNAGLCEA
ncbi:MAG: AAA family ATPase, partial [Desulfovibrionaceae bacterium]|nr:AAA family ATPase [Desulfovibrionaceae bacterium]